MTLEEAATGLDVVLVAGADVRDGRPPRPPVARRLAELGLRAGAPVRIQNRTSGGGAIVAVGEDRIALSRDILRAVRVEPASAPTPAPGGRATQPGPERRDG
jgi:ferrous iron transport protein A